MQHNIFRAITPAGATGAVTDDCDEATGAIVLRRGVIRAALPLLAAAGILAVLSGTASAQVTPDPVAGRERVKVTITSTEAMPLNCEVSVNGTDPAKFPVAAGGRQSIVISQVAPGPQKVYVKCDAGGVTKLDVPLQVDVDLANPALDAVDSVFISAGSSALASDPTLR